ncbi:MAG: glutamate racemase [Pirellulaceae bacterium]|jgi:glutamate racemase
MNKRVLSVLACLTLFSIGNLSAETNVEKAPLLLVKHAVSDSKGETAFTFHPTDYPNEPLKVSDLPIGVFDSGIGGLTVLEAILSSDKFHNKNLKPGPDGLPDLENESFIYLGDSANMPYGNYPSEDKVDTLREHIVKDVVFLMGRRYWKNVATKKPSFDKPPVKAVVIACNTATAYGIEDIREAFESWNVPVIVVGVVEAGARGVKSVWDKKSKEAVAVYATVGTCKSKAYPKSIQMTLGRAGYGPAVVVQQGSVELAGTIEGTLTDKTVDEVVREDIRILLERHRENSLQAKLAPTPIGTVILGCTHYPLAEREIDKAFSYWAEWKDGKGNSVFKPWIAEERTFVDPASWTARELFVELAKARIRKKTSGRNPTQFFVSVPHPEGPGKLNEEKTGFTYQYKYGREANQLSVEDTKIVPMSFDRLPKASQNLIREKLPNVAKAILETP